MRESRVKYLSYYDTPGNAHEGRYYVLAASDKMDYIIGALNRSGYAVDVVSASTTRGRSGHKGRVMRLDGLNTLRVFRTLRWGGKARRVMSVLSLRLLLFAWLLQNCRKGESVIVYHSLGYAAEVNLAKRLRGFRLVLEVEEIYADVTGRTVDRRREYGVFRQADAFIFPTVLLSERLNTRSVPQAIVHGVYQTETTRRRTFDDGRIHVVYAGTFDPRKGGAAAAAAASLFLDDRYHIHIIGFGSPAETRSLLDSIGEYSVKTECKVTYDGLLAGEDYIEFLQSCDIGLSTQRSDAPFNETSFPSKVLSYMANGLRVVSARIRALEQSSVGDLVFYYDEDTPRAVAEAIAEVDLSKSYACVERLRRLDAEFVRQLGELMSE